MMTFKSDPGWKLIYIYIYMYYVCVYIYIYIDLYVYIHVYIYIYVHVYVCIYTYVYLMCVYIQYKLNKPSGGEGAALPPAALRAGDDATTASFSNVYNIYIYIYIYTYIYIYIYDAYTYIYIYIYIVVSTHNSFLIRRQRGHPGVVVPPVISNLANNQEGCCNYN